MVIRRSGSCLHRCVSDLPRYIIDEGMGRTWVGRGRMRHTHWLRGLLSSAPALAGQTISRRLKVDYEKLIHVCLAPGYWLGRNGAGKMTLMKDGCRRAGLRAVTLSLNDRDIASNRTLA